MFDASFILRSPEAQNYAAVASGDAVSPPFEIAQILVDSHVIERPPSRVPEVWKDETSMATQGNHGIPLINAALPYAAGMRVHVPDHAKLFLAAVFPQGCLADSVKCYCAPLVSVRIKIVVTDKGRHEIRCRILRREQKRSTLAAASTPLFQLNDKPTPQQDRNRYLLLRLIRGQGNLHN
jgi:hypothetical protein